MKLIIYVNDLVVVAVAKHLVDVRIKFNDCIYGLRRGLATLSIELAEQKTEALLMSSKKIEGKISRTVGECEVVSQPQLKYLGAILSSRLKFKKHLETITGKIKAI